MGLGLRLFSWNILFFFKTETLTSSTELIVLGGINGVHCAGTRSRGSF